jgi:hypothetical protein
MVTSVPLSLPIERGCFIRLCALAASRDAPDMASAPAPADDVLSPAIGLRFQPV